MTEHTNLSSLFPSEKDRLRAFRRVAADLYRILGNDIGARLTVGSEGRQLLPEASIRAAAPTIRLVLLKRELANFQAVTEALFLLKDPAVNRRVDAIREKWEQVERGSITFFDGNEPLAGAVIRDAFLYGDATHQGDNWEEKLERLRREGALADFALQVSLLGHARLIMALDAVIADVYDEPHVWTLSDARDERFFG